MRRFLALIMAMVFAAATAASAADAREVLHLKATMGPFVHDYPAGTVCDFAYHEEFVNTSNVKIFFDEEGKVVQVEEHAEVWAVHRNVDTGFTLTEVVNYALHFDLIAGEVKMTGNWWHLRDAGRIVFVGSGTFIRDLATGQLVKATPNVGADFAQVNCTALGGSPA